jgi:hypothetical protein
LTKTRKRKRKSRYHTGLHESPKVGTCKYRSGWELAYFQYLDTNDHVLSYKYESLKIPYVSNVRAGKVRNYIPDLLVLYTDGHEVMIEIKPKKKLVQAAVKKKLEAAKEYCAAHGLTLEIITELELKVLGLL